MKQNRYFRTTNLNLAVFLYASDHPISGINVVDGDQKEFAFVNGPVLEELVDLYKFGNRDDDRLLVPIHKYEQARRELLDRLKRD
jgi:hypothetical protein